MLSSPEIQFSEQQILDYYKQNYKNKICNEVDFESTLELPFNKLYKKYKKSKCCIKPLPLLIYSIFILIIACAGFYFSISENKGYKAFKGVDSFNKQASTATWILKIARNVTYDYFRRKRVIQFFSF